MKWAHLPEPGGLYDQNPDLLDHFQIIFSELAAEDARREAERKNKESKNTQMGRGGGRRRGGVRRR